MKTKKYEAEYKVLKDIDKIKPVKRDIKLEYTMRFEGKETCKVTLSVN